MALLGLHTSVYQRQFNVALSRKARNKVEALKNEADFKIPYTAQLIVVHVGNVLAVENVCSACHNVKQTEHIHKR